MQKRNKSQAPHLIAHLGLQLAGETRLDSFLDIMAGEIMTFLAAKHCRIYPDPSGRRYRGSKPDGFRPLGGERGRRMLGALRRGISVRFDSGKGKLKNLVAVPMIGHDGKILGFIEVANKSRGPFDADDEGFLMLVASIAGYALDNERLNRDLRDSYLETIYKLATVAEYRDPEDLSGHLRRMSRYSAILAEGMGFSRIQTRQILYASPLHDIGKVAIPDKVLLKPGKLTPEEFDIIKTHTTFGAEILSNAKSELLKMASRIALFHHEKFNGSGYPKGLAGEKIPIEARIVSVADVFDALVSRRVYKPPWDVKDVINYIRERKGVEFDPKVVDAFDTMWKRIDAIMNEEWPEWGEKRPTKASKQKQEKVIEMRRKAEKD